jgi:hypothetical protein
MNERFIAFNKLLISDEEFPKPVGPEMSRFHNPALVLGWASASSLLSSCPWRITPRTYLFAGRFSVIPLIRIYKNPPYGRAMTTASSTAMS